MARLRRVLTAAGGAACTALAAPASADHCHAPAPRDAGGEDLRVATAFEAATYDNDHGRGYFEGLSLAGSYAWSRFFLRAVVPAYLLTRDDTDATGLGDVVAQAHVAVLGDDRSSTRVGVGLALTLPTGSSSDGLGMGHVMVMPGLWAEQTGALGFLQAELVYARAIAPETEAEGESAHHHHHGGQSGHASGAIVAPMSTSEIGANASAGYRLDELLRLRAGTYGAVPLRESDGRARGVALLATDLSFGRWHVAFEGHAPFYGDPFTLKGITVIGMRL